MKHFYRALKITLAMAAFAAAVILTSSESLAAVGWNYYDGGWHYVTEDYKVYRNILVEIDGVKRFFNMRGICNTGFNDPIIIPDEASKSDTELKVDKMANEVLGKILKDGMTDDEKIEAIYNWIRSNMGYVDQSVKDNWVQAAYDGFRKKTGDCFTYYGVSTALLTAAGYPCMEICRSSDGRHWWLKVQNDKGWYHFDATPRSKDDRKFCMQTDAFMKAYSAAHTSWRGYTTHAYDDSKYPPSPEPTEPIPKFENYYSTQPEVLPEVTGDPLQIVPDAQGAGTETQDMLTVQQ